MEEMILNKNLIHFSDNQEWNDWAVSTPMEVKYEGYDFRNFKMPLKKHLHEFTKDTNYTKNKIKVSSWRNYRTMAEFFKRTPLYIKNDWTRGWS
jgi:hypothetical protein